MAKQNKNEGKIRPHIIQLLLIVIGLTMTILGLLRGEALEVLRKAIVVCLECIGIG